MKFFCAKGTISIATAIMLEETGIAYEPVLLNFAEGDQLKPEYQAINPKGRVPALVTDHGILTETGAILEYLDATASTNMVPTDPWEGAQLRAVMDYLASTFHVNHAHKLRGIRWADQQSSYDDMKAKVPETMGASCTYIEENCPLSPFVMGAAITVADPWLYTICTWLKGDGVEIGDYPKLSAHFDMMNARPSVAAVRSLGLIL